MPLRSPHLGTATALTLLALLSTTATALALDGGHDHDPATGHQNTATATPSPTPTSAGRNDAPAQYRGRVTARSGLLLRTAPNRDSRPLRTARYGEIVPLSCRTRGQRVDGTDIWYLLTDGTWAWGSGRYIQPVGATPRWC